MAGDGLAYAHDPATGAFHLAARAPLHAPETLVEVPPEVRGAASVAGAAELTAEEPVAGGGRLLHVQPAGVSYTVTVATAALALAGCA